MNTLASGCFRGFSEKEHLNTWLCVGISLLLVEVSKDVASLLVWGAFFVSDVIRGGLLGHLGPLCLALGVNC